MIIQAQAQRRGVALVLVLAFLVLISVFVIGFFVSATSELQQSSGYAATISTQQLSESATNIVIGQIREATTRPGEVWASQPGMVRTFRTNFPASFYKLYSSNKMVVEGKGGSGGDMAVATFRPDSDVPIGTEGWNHKPAIFVDLNDPVRVPLPNSESGVSGTLGKDYEYRYPIFDPASFYLRNSVADAGNFPQVAAGGGVAVSKQVEGAELIKNAGDDSSNTTLGADKKTVYTRMPVRWLYILKDGTVTSPVRDLKGTVAQWDDVGKDKSTIPSVNNPIVGRVAFWTDDESCKVNLNTAGGFTTYRIANSQKNEDMYCGSYWDSPRFYTVFDRGDVNVNDGSVVPENMSLALAQPVRNEFQRYPGHPSTTSLGLVFKNMLTSAQIYALTPRLTGGMDFDSGGRPWSGSDGGTRRLIQAKGAGNESLPLKRERLYSSVDELLFAAAKSTDPLTQLRTLNEKKIEATGITPPSGGITPNLVDRMHFFLTAHSRAPELNVFGRPRVTIWPLWPIYTPAGANTGDTYNALSSAGTKVSREIFRTRVNSNPTEKLIAFCSTLGPKDNDTAVRPYFFQRSNPYSATEDGNLPRNLKLFKYLTDMMGQPVLGSSGKVVDTPASFQEKYPGEIDNGSESPGAGDYHQLIAEVFDYIRCVNLNDTSHDIPAPGNQAVTPDKAGYVGGRTFPEYKYSQHAYVVPTMTTEKGATVGPLNRSPGFGRFPTISEATLVFYHGGYVVWDPPFGKDPRRRVRLLYDRKVYYDVYAKSGQTPNPAPPGGLRELALSGGTLQKDPNGRVIPGERVLGIMMKAFVMFENFTPMHGYAAESGFNLDKEVKPRGLFFQHECTGLNAFTATSPGMPSNTTAKGNLNLPPTPKNNYTINRYWDSPFGNLGYLGGIEGFFQTLSHCYQETPPLTAGLPSDPYYYPFQSSGPWPLPTSDGKVSGSMPTDDPAQPAYLDPFTFSTSGGTATSSFQGLFVPKADKVFKFESKQSIVKVNISFAGTVTSKLELNFPDSTENHKWPVPTDNIWFEKSNSGGGMWHEGPKDPAGDGSFTTDNKGNIIPNGVLKENSTFSLAGRVRVAREHNLNPWSLISGGDGKRYGHRHGQFLQPGDTIRSLIPFNPNSRRPNVNSVGMGDPRAIALIGLNSSVRGKYFQPHPLYDTSKRHAQGLRNADTDPYFQGYARDPDVEFNKKQQTNDANNDLYTSQTVGSEIEASRYFETHFGNMLLDMSGKPIPYKSGTVSADLPPDVKQVFRSDGLKPDFDTGLAGTPDGGYCNKSDEGSNAWRSWDNLQKKWYYHIPYYLTNREGGYDTYFSPNKQMPSPVQFGSLLAGRTKHWQTLCFCPNSIGNPHPGNTVSPQDHYLLDLFTMPVVEPYAISEPFSTAGKINLNYAIAPFNHIRRSTGMRAILHPVRIVAVPNADSLLYKQDPNSGGILLPDRNFRFRVDRDETLRAFQAYFDGTSGGGGQAIFRTGSQICEMYLYPNMYLTEVSSATGARAPKKEMTDIGIDPPKFTPGNNAMKHFWDMCVLTGDNLREKPYNDIYPRITTKSNTFTVHMWVQGLKKGSTAGLSKAAAANAQLSWDESKDQVVAEYRGSSIIERYIDPEDRRFDPKNIETATKSDYLDPDSQSLEQLYRFRVIESKRFNP